MLIVLGIIVAAALVFVIQAQAQGTPTAGSCCFQSASYCPPTACQSACVGWGNSGMLTAEQIGQYAANAGFTGDDLAISVAVALAESGGNPSARGDVQLSKDTNGAQGPSIGLWQINIGSAAHPNYAGVGLTDPQVNAQAAFAIYTVAGGFRPWSTFRNGQYGAYLPEAQQAVNA